MNNYGSYKTSGLDYLDKIPFHWNVLPNKRLFSEYFGGSWGDDPKDDQEAGLVRVIRVTEFDFDKLVVSQSIPTVRSIELDADSRKLIKKYDLILEKSGGGEKTPVGRVVLVDREMEFPTINSNFTNICRPDTQLVNPRFLVYSLYSSYVDGQTLRNIKQTTGIQNLDLDGFMSEKSVLPPLDEQRLIANYLDRKIGTVNSLIDKIQKKIDLIKEQRTSLINQYVTKGLDPNVEMKDSGVEWIGEIPKHWKIQKISTLYSQSSIRGYEDEQNLSVFRDYGVVRRDDYENKNVLSEDLSNYKLVYKGDLVLNKMKTWMGSLGVSEYQGIVSPAYYVLRPNFDFFSGYLHHLLRSKIYIDQYASVSKGVRPGQWDLSFDEFKSLKVILPPVDEQKIIYSKLTRQLDINSRLSELETKKIERLNEYKQSLVSSFVIGKNRVTEDMI